MSQQQQEKGLEKAKEKERENKKAKADKAVIEQNDQMKAKLMQQKNAADIGDASASAGKWQTKADILFEQNAKDAKATFADPIKAYESMITTLGTMYMQSFQRVLAAFYLQLAQDYDPENTGMLVTGLQSLLGMEPTVPAIKKMENMLKALNPANLPGATVDGGKALKDYLTEKWNAEANVELKGMEYDFKLNSADGSFLTTVIAKDISSDRPAPTEEEKEPFRDGIRDAFRSFVDGHPDYAISNDNKITKNPNGAITKDDFKKLTDEFHVGAKAILEANGVPLEIRANLESEYKPSSPRF